MVVILSGAKNLFPQVPAKASTQDCGKRFFTPAASAQNDGKGSRGKQKEWT
jgi:hypothetical protein